VIICHRHQFVFVKTAKTAGTSVEIFLTQFCGEHDVVTPIKEEDERTRAELGFGCARNYSTELGKFWNHMSYFEARELMLRLQNIDLDQYYSFTIERHPGEKAVSLYYWANKGTRNSPYDDESFFFKRVALLKERGWQLYALNDDIAVDNVILFEDLQRGLGAVLKYLNIDCGVELPNAKAGVRRDRRSYKDILSPRVQKYIGKVFSQELKQFNYRL